MQDDYVIIFGQNKNIINSKNMIRNEINKNDGNYKNDINQKYKYYIIDNRMKENVKNNIIYIVSHSFNENKFTKERAEYIKNKLVEEYSYIYWNVFIYQNGYCKVSFSDELYICGKILNDYIIIFGQYKKNNKIRDRNKRKTRSRSLSPSQKRNRSRSRDKKEN